MNKFENPFLIRLYSFSYKNGGPEYDPAENGGGYVFDCRCLLNPGRIPEFRNLTGEDPEVISMLERSEEVEFFLDHTFDLVASTADAYKAQGYKNLQVMFGCTGGRHRSVFCANELAKRLTYAGFRTMVVHWQMEKEEPEHGYKRAMIFAAGVGDRLQPLTIDTPKALIEAGGKTMLEWTFQALNKNDFSPLAINLHHHPGKIISALEKLEQRDSVLQINLSCEPELLGTGRGLRFAARWLYNPNPVLIHNVDVWTSFDLNRIYQSHRSEDLATLVCQERESSRYLIVDSDNQVCGVHAEGTERKYREPSGKIRLLGFSGIHVVSPKLFRLLQEREDISIMDSYYHFISEGETVRALEVEGDWFDMGTEDKLEKLRNFLDSRN